MEACVYFVCAEALTNVGKHAAATRVVVEVRQQTKNRARISDDGRGGADPASGTACAGSPTGWKPSAAHHHPRRPGEGTTVVATFPAGDAISAQASDPDASAGGGHC